VDHPVLDEDTGPYRHIVFWIGDGLLGLHVFPGGLREEGPFHPYRPGLDHIAFGVPDRAGLEKWQNRLDELGIAHGGIVDASYGSALSCPAGFGAAVVDPSSRTSTTISPEVAPTVTVVATGPACRSVLVRASCTTRYTARAAAAATAPRRGPSGSRPAVRTPASCPPGPAPRRGGPR
jgi:hypothetical protein